MKSLALHMRISTLNPNDDEVNSRRAAGTALASAWAKSKLASAAIERAQQVAEALWSDLPPVNLAAEVETSVQVHSSSFLASDRPLEVGICAAVAVSGMLDSKVNVEGFSATDVFATALWSALSFQPPLQDAKREAMRVEILEGVQARAMAAADLSRARTAVDDFGAFSVVDGDEAKTTTNFKKATGDTIKALRRNAALDREEIDFLWWTLVARSRVLKKPLQAIDEPVRAVVAGIEAAQYLRRFPCEAHRELVLRSLDTNPFLNLNALIDALGESREKVATAYLDTADTTAQPLVFPLLNTIHTGVVDVEGASIERSSEEWGARALLEAGLLHLSVVGVTSL
ncbi:hypothetical protein CTTA_4579 [Comamonas testosteroni]|uniref:GTPase-associated system helical domain-containing protein n=1 Tax=Comamonas testosteroni TaxID=285 RepID=A0A5A7ML72_COMTE|nr:GTPase-associated system all-helical protein GASH [Comamonas testosteroni]GEQ77574.1 hypothetical protein CTTA_4579 [Comamonas testosteroni]